MPTRCILAGAENLRPLMQGDLSRLCGLYSVINAIRLILYPQVLAQSDIQALYLHGVRHLAHHRQLNRVMGVGMYDDVWSALAGRLVEHTNDACGSALKLVPILAGPAIDQNRSRALASIRRQIRSPSPVLISCGGALSHYTVVSGYTDQRMLLFDSSGLRWLLTDNIGLGESSSRRHWLTAAGVIALINDW